MDQCSAAILPQKKHKSQGTKSKKLLFLDEIEMEVNLNAPVPITRGMKDARKREGMANEGDISATVAAAVIYTIGLPKKDGELERQEFYLSVYKQKLADAVTKK